MKHDKAIMIRRGRWGKRGKGVLEVEHIWGGQEGGLWLCTIRGRKGRRKGSFVLEKPEAILLADMLAETAPPLLHRRDD
jgi:hypothetical protein